MIVELGCLLFQTRRLENEDAKEQSNGSGEEAGEEDGREASSRKEKEEAEAGNHDGDSGGRNGVRFDLQGNVEKGGRVMRLENCGPEVDEWCENTGEGSSTIDVCAGCASGMYLENAKPIGQNEPEGEWEGNVDHPSYSDDDYHCALCKRLLQDGD